MAAGTNHQSQLDQLRATAQAHLSEIEADIAQETAHEHQAQSEIEKYMKQKAVRRKSRSPKAPATEERQGKGPRFRSAQDVLDRLRWDHSLDLTEYHVGYLERFEGIKEMPVVSWIKDFTDEEWIPQHRIKYFKRSVPGADSEIVWDRDARIDTVFGSGRSIAAGIGNDEDLFSLDGSSVVGGVQIQ